MTKSRLEAFTDGVFAILITILVLELRAPHGSDFEALQPLFPVFLTYVLSFIYLGIYWVGHHHMFLLVTRVNGKILWANMLLLFCLSLLPFATGWMGENHFASVPTAGYGVLMVMTSVAFKILQAAIIEEQGEGSKLAAAVGGDLKGKISVVIYIVAVGFAFINQWVSDALYVLVAAMWFIPDTRIERRIKHG
jgi:uncharacterized membrane protein